MADIIPFPQLRAHLALENWAEEVDQKSTLFLGWAFPDGIPGEVGDAWYGHCTHCAVHGCDSWKGIYHSFLEVYICRHPDLVAQMSQKLGEYASDLEMAARAMQ